MGLLDLHLRDIPTPLLLTPKVHQIHIPLPPIHIPLLPHLCPPPPSPTVLPLNHLPLQLDILQLDPLPLLPMAIPQPHKEGRLLRQLLPLLTLPLLTPNPRERKPLNQPLHLHMGKLLIPPLLLAMDTPILPSTLPNMPPLLEDILAMPLSQLQAIMPHTGTLLHRQLDIQAMGAMGLMATLMGAL